MARSRLARRSLYPVAGPLEKCVMLRITRMAGNDSVDTLKLEGKLLWVLEAHNACARSAAQASGTCLDLSSLTFADGEGAVLLRELIRGGAQVVGCSSYIAELLQLSAGSGRVL
jgi:hypothetical protein